MTYSKLFLEEIKNHIESIDDPVFVQKTKNPDKSIEKCVAYILATVQKSEISGWADDEIFGMARHYFDEDNIDDMEHSSCRIVINREVHLTEQEIADAKKKAIDSVFADQKRKMTAPPKPKSNPSANQKNTLF